MKRLLARLAVLVASLWLTGVGFALDEEDPLTRVRARGSIEFAMYNEFPPWSSAGAGGAPVGVDVDLARAIAARLGVSARIRLFEAQEDLGDDLRNVIWKGHYLAGGVSDVMLHVPYDRNYAAREKNTLFFSPYFHEKVVVLFKPGVIRNFSSPMALTGHRVAVQGDTISDYLVSNAFNGALRTTAVRARTLVEAVQSFRDGEADALMAPKGELEGIMKASGVDVGGYEQHELAGVLRTQWNVGIAVRNEDERASLRDAVATALEGLRADGELDRIFRAHGVTRAEPTTVDPPPAKPMPRADD
ncbi:MAG TPA: transporter substrate-binding domain-containing protein [Nevskiaceae bacterium]|nr:transporter substrate-binding domain-containing protein [Nevskiaceae bacterium]